jgi:hypothetical protein
MRPGHGLLLVLLIPAVPSSWSAEPPPPSVPSQLLPIVEEILHLAPLVALLMVGLLVVGEVAPDASVRPSTCCALRAVRVMSTDHQSVRAEETPPAAAAGGGGVTAVAVTLWLRSPRLDSTYQLACRNSYYLWEYPMCDGWGSHGTQGTQVEALQRGTTST